MHKNEKLPFTVPLATSENDLAAVARIRADAYGRHLPELAKSLLIPEPMDREQCATVLLVTQKDDGAVLGTIRIQTNQDMPLALEKSVHLPDWLQGKYLAEATRLALMPGPLAQSVKSALFKSFYLVCKQKGIDWMVIAGRPPVDRMYERLLFRDVLAKGQYIPLIHAGGIPHRVMAFEVHNAHRRWARAKHPLLSYVVDTVHPDLEVVQESDRPDSARLLPQAAVATACAI